MKMKSREANLTLGILFRVDTGEDVRRCLGGIYMVLLSPLEPTNDAYATIIRGVQEAYRDPRS